MKKIILSTLLLISLTSYSQWGVHAGPNISSYTGGSKPYTGLKNAIFSPKFGIYKKTWLNNKTYLQTEVDFLMLGAENPIEKPERFQTFHVNLPVLIGVKKGNFYFQGGLYVNRMLAARNYTWFGENSFSWKIKDWKYLDKWYVGGQVGVGYDLIGMEIQANYMHDFNKCQDIAWDYNIKKLGYNHALSLSAYIPFKIKKEIKIKLP